MTFLPEQLVNLIVQIPNPKLSETGCNQRVGHRQVISFEAQLQETRSSATSSIKCKMKKDLKGSPFWI